MNLNKHKKINLLTLNLFFFPYIFPNIVIGFIWLEKNMRERKLRRKIGRKK